MAIFDQRAGMTWGSDLLRIVTNMQQLQMQREQLEMEKEAQKLAERKAKHQLQLQEAGLQQILGMPQTIESISPAQANQIADATQPGRDATYLAARQGATKAIETGSPAEAAIAAQFLDLPPALGMAAREEAGKEKAKRGLESLLSDLPGQDMLSIAQLAFESGNAPLATMAYERWANENPDTVGQIAQETAKANLDLINTRIEQGLQDLDLAPLRLRTERAKVAVAEADVEFRREQLAFQRLIWPVEADYKRAQLVSLQLDNDLNRKLNPYRVAGAATELTLADLTVKERRAAMDLMEQERNGETPPQQELAKFLQNPDVVGLSPEAADAVVRGMTAGSAANALLTLSEIPRANARERRQYAFTLFKEFGMPHINPFTGQWEAAPVRDAETFDRVIGNIYGDVLPVDEMAMLGVGNLRRLIAGGENATDPAVHAAVVDELVANVDAALTADGRIPANAITSEEKAELRKAVAIAAAQQDLDDAYEKFVGYIEASKRLSNLRNRLGVYDRSSRAKSFLAERLWRGTAENAVGAEAMNNPITLEDLRAQGLGYRAQRRAAPAAGAADVFPQE